MIKHNNLFTQLSKEVQQEFLIGGNAFAIKELRTSLEKETAFNQMTMENAARTFWVVYPLRSFDYSDYINLFNSK